MNTRQEHKPKGKASQKLPDMDEHDPLLAAYNDGNGNQTAGHSPLPWAMDYDRTNDRFALRSTKTGSFGHFQGWSGDGVTTENEDQSNARLIVASVNNAGKWEDLANNALADALDWKAKCRKAQAHAGKLAEALREWMEEVPLLDIPKQARQALAAWEGKVK